MTNEQAEYLMELHGLTREEIRASYESGPWFEAYLEARKK